MSQQQRMVNRPASHKPRVFKITPAGMWWADVMTPADKYECDVFPTHREALSKAHEYGQQIRAQQ